MKKNFPVIGLSKVWFSLSAALIIASIVSVATLGLNLGIDFTGGSLMEVQFSEETSIDAVRESVREQGFEPVVQKGEEGAYFIRIETIDRDQHDALSAHLSESIGEFEELRFDSIGPVIGDELKRKSFSAMILLLFLIVVYVAWAFRRVSKPIASWKYGLLTIVAALHDIIIPIGVFAILGKYLGFQVDTAFVAAMLTILGYSINDTIVVFDRTRENLVSNRHSDASFAEIVNKSVVQSFARSINTSLTTLLVLLAIFLFGGETTRPFILALMIGILSGAYSSIFLASPLLVSWERRTRK